MGYSEQQLGKKRYGLDALEAMSKAGLSSDAIRQLANNIEGARSQAVSAGGNPKTQAIQRKLNSYKSGADQARKTQGNVAYGVNKTVDAFSPNNKNNVIGKIIGGAKSVNKSYENLRKGKR